MLDYSNSDLQELWSEYSYVISYLIAVLVIVSIVVGITMVRDNKRSSIKYIRSEFNGPEGYNEDSWLNSNLIKVIGLLGSIASIVAILFYLNE